MDSSALLTDLYQLTMAYGYWKLGLLERQATFHHFFRRAPFKGSYAIAAGLDTLISFIENFKFSASDLFYLESLKNESNDPLFDPRFLDFLSNMKWEISLDALPEGTVCFPNTPITRVQGPLIQCQLLETPLLNLLNFPTLIATYATRLVKAAHGDSIMEFGLRRAPGPNGALAASRAAYIGGINSTSNVLAGKLYGIPLSGTQSHSWILSFRSELDAFDKFAASFPKQSIFLVDTFDTLQGIQHAIQAGNQLKSQGNALLGIRLDSGDLAELSIKARELLDQAGFKTTKIYASGDLDDSSIASLKERGAKIDAWGVGTSLATGKGDVLDGVYKLSAIKDSGRAWIYKLKLSEDLQKTSIPGVLQTARLFNEAGRAIQDVVYDTELGFDADFYTDLLVPIFKKGQRIYETPPLETIRQSTLKNIRNFEDLDSYQVALEPTLEQIRQNLIRTST